MHATALEKIKMEADEKLYRFVRGNGTCMMVRTSPELSYIAPQMRMARDDTSPFELDKNPPIDENDHSESQQGLDENVRTDNGCSKDNSGLEEIPEQTSTAVRNGDM